MAHFARIDENNIVQEVIVISDEFEQNGQDYINNVLNKDGRWLQTSYNTINGEHRNGGTPFRGNYAGIGYYYDENLDAFIPHKPFNSWILDTNIYDWVPPVPHPGFNKDLPPAVWDWNEDIQNWEASPLITFKTWD